MRAFKPEELFDSDGRPMPELLALVPRAERRMAANPHGNGGHLTVDLDLPDFRYHAVPLDQPGRVRAEATPQLGKMLRAVIEGSQHTNHFRLFCSDAGDRSRFGSGFEVEDRRATSSATPADSVVADGRVLEVLSQHLCHGCLHGYLLTGRHGFLLSRESLAMVTASMSLQHSQWLVEAARLSWRRPTPSLNCLLSPTCWRNDHDGLSHQGPGLIDALVARKGSVARVYFPPDANCLLSVADHCLRSRNAVNVIVIDGGPALQWLGGEAAVSLCAHGAAIWDWASSEDGRAPDVVLAAAGDTATLEIMATAWLLRARAPGLRFRVVNVVDLMSLFPRTIHPLGMDESRFLDLFTADVPVVFAFHGYPRALHHVLHGRPRTDRFHVRGFIEAGPTTTPFDMVVRNEVSRFHLCIEAVRRSQHRQAAGLVEWCREMLAAHETHTREHLEDLPQVRDWQWD
jgi:xylulose-5-phosphate/fructose-6-phosphate phosphoketolase